GFVIPIILRAGSSVFTYRATVMSAGSISNIAEVAGYGLTAEAVVEAPVTPPTPGILDFTNAGATPVTFYLAGDNVYIQIEDPDPNTAAGTPQSFDVIVENLNNGDLEIVTVTETGNDTDIFRNTGDPLPTSL